MFDNQFVHYLYINSRKNRCLFIRKTPLGWERFCLFHHQIYTFYHKIIYWKIYILLYINILPGSLQLHLYIIYLSSCFPKALLPLFPGNSKIIIFCNLCAHIQKLVGCKHHPMRPKGLYKPLDVMGHAP